MQTIIYNTQTGVILATPSEKQDAKIIMTHYADANFIKTPQVVESIWDYKVNLETGQVEKI